VNTNQLLTALWNTLAVSALCSLIALPVGALLAVLLSRSNVWGRSGLWVALCSQLAVPLYVIAAGWSAGFGIQGWLRSSTGDLWGWELFGTPLTVGAGSVLAVSVIHALASIPWVCLIVTCGLVWAHRGQEEMALLDGGSWHLWRFIILPKMRIWLIASCLWCSMPILTEMVVTNLYQVPTLAEQIYLDVSRGTIHPWTYLTASCLCMLPIFLGGTWLHSKLPSWNLVIASVAHYRGRSLELAHRRFLTSAALCCVVLMLVGWPLLNLLIKAGWQPALDAQGRAAYGWSFVRLWLTAHEALTLYGSELKWSAVLATASTALALLTAATCGFLFRTGWARTAITLLALLMIAVPGPLVGMTLIGLMNRSWPPALGWLYDTTLTAPILAQQFRLFPMAWLFCSTILATISTQVRQQAALDGLHRLQFARTVLWASTWRLWLTSALILMALSVGELSCSMLVLPPGVTTLSMRLFEMLHFGMRHQDSGLSGLLVALGWLVAVVSWKTLKDR
jgi:iron(III) transport system permease protein